MKRDYVAVCGTMTAEDSGSVEESVASGQKHRTWLSSVVALGLPEKRLIAGAFVCGVFLGACFFGMLPGRNPSTTRLHSSGISASGNDFQREFSEWQEVRNAEIEGTWDPRSRLKNRDLLGDGFRLSNMKPLLSRVSEKEVARLLVADSATERQNDREQAMRAFLELYFADRMEAGMAKRNLRYLCFSDAEMEELLKQKFLGLLSTLKAYLVLNEQSVSYDQGRRIKNQLFLSWVSLTNQFWQDFTREYRVEALDVLLQVLRKSERDYDFSEALGEALANRLLSNVALHRLRENDPDGYLATLDFLSDFRVGHALFANRREFLETGWGREQLFELALFTTEGIQRQFISQALELQGEPNLFREYVVWKFLDREAERFPEYIRSEIQRARLSVPLIKLESSSAHEVRARFLERLGC